MKLANTYVHIGFRDHGILAGMNSTGPAVCMVRIRPYAVMDMCVHFCIICHCHFVQGVSDQVLIKSFL